MELDEILYSKVLQFIRRNKKVSKEILERTVALDSLKPRLIILARAATKKDISIFEAEKEGGYRNENFFLPSSMSIFKEYADNLSFYIFRTLYLSTQYNLRLNWHDTEPDYATSVQKAHETSQEVLETLFTEFPVLEEKYLALYQQIEASEKPCFYWLFGKWMKNDSEIESTNELKNISENTKKLNEQKQLTILKAKAVEKAIIQEIDKKQQEDYVLTHNFEKVETADEFDGNWRDFDGEDELESHKDAIDELSMKYMVRVDDENHSVYQADFIENTSVSESAELDEKAEVILYDEWDFQQKIYKKDFCKVYAQKEVNTDAAFYHSIIQKKASLLIGLRKMLSNLNNKMAQKRRLIHGDNIDIDAATEMITDVLSKKTPLEKIYISNRKTDKEISILLLLDISLSSDSYAAGNRVIDVEKQVSILFGELLNEYAIDFSIQCFYSKTRNHSSYITLKGFDESWQNSKFRIGAIEPQGYTRIGVALRHSAELMKQRKAKNKWVILISDGKPNDYDKYEGKYGVNDVKQALKEMSSSKINSYALTIEAQARYYLPQMFGKNHYQILTTPEELINALVKLFEKIKYQG